VTAALLTRDAGSGAEISAAAPTPGGGTGAPAPGAGAGPPGPGAGPAGVGSARGARVVAGEGGAMVCVWPPGVVMFTTLVVWLTTTVLYLLL
jgi:hypothetical protein